MMGGTRQSRSRRPIGSDSPTRRSSSGYALIGVLVFLTITVMSMIGSFDIVHQLFTFEKADKRIPDSEDGVDIALGMGISRLQTGEPPMTPYTCKVRLPNSDGVGAESFHVSYVQLGSDTWSVEAEVNLGPASACPSVFDGECPWVIP